MHFHEAGEHQLNWQDVRGMNERINGKCNLNRGEDEVVEAWQETDPIKLVGEMVDILIIFSAGAAMACRDAGIPVKQLDALIEAKLKINDIKYNLDYAPNRSPEDFVAFCRHYWALGLSPQEVENYYSEAGENY